MHGASLACIPITSPAANRGFNLDRVLTQHFNSALLETFSQESCIAFRLDQSAVRIMSSLARSRGLLTALFVSLIPCFRSRSMLSVHPSEF